MAKAKTGGDSPKIVVKETKPIIKDKTPSGFIVADGGTYEAKVKCYFGISLYDEGSRLQTKKGQKIPHHFKKVKKFVEVVED